MEYNSIYSLFHSTLNNPGHRRSESVSAIFPHYFTCSIQPILSFTLHSQQSWPPQERKRLRIISSLLHLFHSTALTNLQAPVHITWSLHLGKLRLVDVMARRRRQQGAEPHREGVTGRRQHVLLVHARRPAVVPAQPHMLVVKMHLQTQAISPSLSHRFAARPMPGAQEQTNLDVIPLHQLVDMGGSV
jgi:hypothetical protein